MHNIVFKNTGESIAVEHATTILEALQQRSFFVRSDCGAKGLCGKCVVNAGPSKNLSPVTESETTLLTLDQLASNCRLACQAKITGDITVSVLEKSDSGKGIEAKTDIRKKYFTNPLVERIFVPRVQVPVDNNGVCFDLAGLILNRASTVQKEKIFFKEPEVLRQLAGLSETEKEITLVFHRQKGITAVLPGTREPCLGLSVDLGTTTIAVYLCDFKTGKLLSAKSTANPQRCYGEDIINRIAATGQASGNLKKMQSLVVEAINSTVNLCLVEAGFSSLDIDEAVVAGNTTMEQIFAGFHPRGLGRAPFFPVSRLLPDLKAADLGLNLNPGTNIHLFPVISGFIGGDTLAVMLTEDVYNCNENLLVIDIGTNSELVLSTHAEIWAASCATGPAFEGGQISCGTRAVPGAIYKVEIDPETRGFAYRVLGESKHAEPTGICGSGIIDAIAAMRKTRLILESGSFNKKMPEVIFKEKAAKQKVVLINKEKNKAGLEIAITLRDVRQIQLAKAAMCAGIELLMEKAKCRRLDRTVLTGAFGAQFNWKNAAVIGMLPEAVANSKIMPENNLAGAGCIMALLNKKKRREAVRFLDHVQFTELATEPDFSAKFEQALLFPPIA
ncbi:MAG: DUF4445 domain-containing protein [Deltaproteobacteria bacterium]|nr:DUF4445 domain-containing protein [Deltaproteobacteria bacterium]